MPKLGATIVYPIQSSQFLPLLSCQLCVYYVCAVVSNLEKIVLTGYKALQLMYYFTAGEDEVKAWTIQVGGHSAAQYSL